MESTNARIWGGIFRLPHLSRIVPGTIDRSYQVHYERNHGQFTGKAKKAPGTWTAWSQKYDWHARAQAFDANEQRKAILRAASKRQKEIEGFIEADMRISLGVQRLTSCTIDEMTKAGVNALELRQITMSYDAARTWLTDLIGLCDLEAATLSNVADSDEALAQQVEPEGRDAP